MTDRATEAETLVAVHSWLTCAMERIGPALSDAGLGEFREGLQTAIRHLGRLPVGDQTVDRLSANALTQMLVRFPPNDNRPTRR